MQPFLPRWPGTHLLPREPGDAPDHQGENVIKRHLPSLQHRRRRDDTGGFGR